MARKTTPAATHESPAPSEPELEALLGDAYPLVQTLVSAPGRAGEWRRFTKNSPWVMRVALGKRPLFYVQPEKNAAKVTVLLGPRSVEAALAGRVASQLHPVITAARAYPEGRPVPVRVRRASDVVRVEELIAVKLKPAEPPARQARHR